MTDTQMVKRDEALFPSTFEGMMKQASEVAKSGLCPNGVTTPQQVLALALAGREMGLGIMESLRSLYIVNQKVAMSAGVMAAKVARAGQKFEVLERTTDKCRIKFYRKDTSTTYEQTYTMKDAQAAGLAGKDVWKKYPAEMLYARCFSTGARIMYADILANIYTPEEMGAVVNADGEVIESGNNTFDEQAVRDMLKKKLIGWYPNQSALAAVWKEYKENHALDIKWKEITVAQLEDFAKWADPEVQKGNVVDAEWDDTSVTPSDAELEADKEAAERQAKNKARKAKATGDIDLTPAGTDAELFTTNPEDIGHN